MARKIVGLPEERDIEGIARQNEQRREGPVGLQRRKEKLYDKIKVSVHTMDIIIYVVVALLLLCLILGVLIK